MKYKGILIHDIVLYKHPLIYCELLVMLASDLFKWLAKFFVRRFLIIIASAIMWGLISNLSILNVIFC